VLGPLARGGAVRLTAPSTAPTRQKTTATNTRGVKKPDLEEEFFFMVILFLPIESRAKDGRNRGTIG
jgi:hypothetical protein